MSAVDPASLAAALRAYFPGPVRIRPDGSGTYEGGVRFNASNLLSVEAIVGAPVEIYATDSDPACGSWGFVEVSWPAPVALDPLHLRARAAIVRLGLDGSRLETAVAVFGWGSAEANGSLLGLMREVWGNPGASPLSITWNDSLWRINISTHGGRVCDAFVGATEALVVALDSAVPS